MIKIYIIPRSKLLQSNPCCTESNGQLLLKNVSNKPKMVKTLHLGVQDRQKTSSWSNSLTNKQCTRKLVNLSNSNPNRNVMSRRRSAVQRSQLSRKNVSNKPKMVKTLHLGVQDRQKPSSRSNSLTNKQCTKVLFIGQFTRQNFRLCILCLVNKTQNA